VYAVKGNSALGKRKRPDETLHTTIPKRIVHATVPRRSRLPTALTSPPYQLPLLSFRRTHCACPATHLPLPPACMYMCHRSPL